MRFDLIIKLMRFVIVGLFIDLRIFVVDGCFGHVFRSMLLVVSFYRYETLIFLLAGLVFFMFFPFETKKTKFSRKIFQKFKKLLLLLLFLFKK